MAGGDSEGESLLPPASEFIRKAAAADIRPFSLNSLIQLLSFSAYGQYLIVWAWSPDAWQIGHW